jgi:hypothetical protein
MRNCFLENTNISCSLGFQPRSVQKLLLELGTIIFKADVGRHDGRATRENEGIASSAERGKHRGQRHRLAGSLAGKLLLHACAAIDTHSSCCCSVHAMRERRARV